MSKLDKLSLLLPMEEIEQEAQNQIYAVLAHDFVKRMAVMPDVHAGYLAPIGSVVEMDDVISPGAVGYDQNCGMAMVRTDIHRSKLTDRKLQKIWSVLQDKIPVGFDSHETSQGYGEYVPFGMEYVQLVQSPKKKLNLQRLNNKINTQVGTLGGNNHFLSVDYDDNGFICVVVHSGSRNVGHQMATFYIELSKLVDKDLPKGFLRFSGEYGQAFYEDLKFTEEFAYKNRLRLLEDACDVLGASFSMAATTLTNETHNHAVADENGMVVHRKGATPAEKGQVGLIPINMEHGTYVTIGKGNKEFMSSASHGAGRTMSRTDAKKKTRLSVFKKQMEGILCKVDQEHIDEAPESYKEPAYVIDRQDGIVVDVVERLRPLIVLKG